MPPSEERPLSRFSAEARRAADVDQASHAHLGRLYVLAAAILWSTSGLFARSPVFHDWPPGTRGVLLAFWRALFAGLLLLPAVRRPSWRWSFAPMLVCFLLMNVTYLQAMTLTTAGNAIWLQSTAPAWVVLASLIWLREPLGRREVLPIGLTLTGVALILTCELRTADGSSHSVIGVLLGLASGVFYAGVLLSLRALRGENSAWLVALNHLVTAAALAPFALSMAAETTTTQLAVLVPFGLLQMGLPYLLLARGLQRVSGTEASLIALIEPVLVPTWTYLAWGERVAWWTIVGGALIVVGLLTRYARPSGRTE
jgi:drug/metabolite transporter, DME family